MKVSGYYFRKILSVPVYVKIITLLFLFVVIIESATITSFYFIIFKKEHLRLERAGIAAGKILSYRVEDFFEAGDMNGLRKMLCYVVKNSTIISYAIVKNNSGKILSYAFKKNGKCGEGHIVYRKREIDGYRHFISHNGNFINLKFPVLISDASSRLGPIGAKIGSLNIGVFSDTFSYFTDITLTFMLFVMLPLFIISLIFFSWISLAVLRPLSDLQKAAESARNGNYGVEVKVPAYADEKLVGLITGFNKMLKSFGKAYVKLENREIRRREFISEIISAQETERKKLSRELHDELEQFLIYVNMKFGMLENDIDMDKRKEHIDEMRENIFAQLDNIKNITRELRPGVLYELGLYKALLQYFSEIKINHGIDVKIYASKMETFSADEYFEINIYRIFQEAVSNIIRHSGASVIKIIMNYENGVFKAVIEDNGNGFAGHDSAETYGIKGMKERAEILGGSVSVNARVGFGATVSIIVPVANSSSIKEAARNQDGTL